MNHPLMLDNSSRGEENQARHNSLEVLPPSAALLDPGGTDTSPIPAVREKQIRPSLRASFKYEPSLPRAYGPKR
jgi:hypothetical protein